MEINSKIVALVVMLGLSIVGGSAVHAASFAPPVPACSSISCFHPLR